MSKREDREAEVPQAQEEAGAQPKGASLDQVLAAITGLGGQLQGLGDTVGALKKAQNANADIVDQVLARLDGLENRAAVGPEALSGLLMRLAALEERPIGTPNGDELKKQQNRALEQAKQSHGNDRTMYHPDLAQCAQERLPVGITVSTAAQAEDARAKGYCGSLEEAARMASGADADQVAVKRKQKELHAAAGKQGTAA